MTHPMSDQWMHWAPIETAPTHGGQILVGFQGQFKWVSYVASANGRNTRGATFAPPTHWTPIIIPIFAIEG